MKLSEYIQMNNIRNIQSILLQLQNLNNLVAVGGCVRDIVMYGKSYGDIDLATSDNKETIIAKLREINLPYHIINDRYATVATLINNAQLIEITPFRKDNGCDGRHTNIEVGTILEDMERRDFNMNAMYMDKTMKIYDPFNGIDDIRNKIIRTCGNARKRFNEDQLRIFRAMRFAATLGFTLGDSILDEIKITPIDKISIERIVCEIDKCFHSCADSNKSSTMFRYMLNTGKLQEILPEIAFMNTLNQSPIHHPEGNVFEHTMVLIDNCYHHYKWEALFHDIGKINSFEQYKDNNYCSFHGHETYSEKLITDIAIRLKLPNRIRNSCIAIAKYHMYPYQITNFGKNKATISNIRKFRHKVGDYIDRLKDIVLSEFQLKDVTQEQVDNINDLFNRKINEKSIINPILTGKFLISKGYIPGKIIGELIQKGLDYQLETGCVDPEEIYENVTKGK